MVSEGRTVVQGAYYNYIGFVADDHKPSYTHPLELFTDVLRPAVRSMKRCLCSCSTFHSFILKSHPRKVPRSEIRMNWLHYDSCAGESNVVLTGHVPLLRTYLFGHTLAETLVSVPGCSVLLRLDGHMEALEMERQSVRNINLP